MLFNSFEFIFFFLPVVFLGYLFLRKSRRKALLVYWLIVASLWFYASWRVDYIFLLLGSILINYTIALVLAKQKQRWLLLAGVLLNLSLLVYFKYLNFFIDILSSALNFNPHYLDVALPLAISFFTFQQIAFLVDVYKERVDRFGLSSYLLFVTFFPQLISGPIVHHREMMPQFDSQKRFSWLLVASGLTLFFIGLFKKVALADVLSPTVDQIFQKASVHAPITMIEAWVGSLGYTLQIYFDFSGYTDMALGLGLLFGIYLPLNFNSPLKSKSIIEFWRRWHITLSRFFRDYVYIPLGGNRKGIHYQLLFLMITMSLAGLWHGAALTMLVWGFLHGLAIAINHVYRLTFSKRNKHKPTSLVIGVSWCATFLLVVILFVLFRSSSLDSALYLIKGLVTGSDVTSLATIPIKYLPQILFILVLLGVVVAFPNSQELLQLNPEKREVKWRPDTKWLAFVTVLSILSFYRMMTNGYVEFIYRFF